MKRRSFLILLALVLAGAASYLVWIKTSSAEALERRADELARDSQYAEAAAELERAISIREAAAPDSIEISRMSSNLGVLYRHLEKPAAAENAYRKALTIAASHGLNDEATATCLHNLGELYEHEKRFDDAIVTLESARKIREKLLPDSPELAQTLSNLGVVYMRMKDYAHAEPFFDRTMSIDAKAFGPKDARVGEDLRNWAFVRLEMGRYEDAEEMLRTALAIQEGALGDTHPALRQTLVSLARLYVVTDRRNLAEPLEARLKTLAPE